VGQVYRTLQRPERDRFIESDDPDGNGGGAGRLFAGRRPSFIGQEPLE